MNGKMAKMLRKMGKDDKASKRMFNSFDANTKGALRRAAGAYVASAPTTEAPVEVVAE